MDQRYSFSPLLFISFLTYCSCQKLCTKNAPSGGLVFRINETGSYPGPSIVLDLSKHLGEQSESKSIILTMDDNPGDYFRLNSSNKHLVLRKPVDRDAENFQMLTLKLTCNFGLDGASEKGNLVVKVFINDINDNAPVFQNTPYTTTIHPRTLVGSVVFDALEAADVDLNENGQVRFRIVPKLGTPANASEYFAIKDNTVILRKPLDRSSYSVIIEAYDSPKNRNERQVSNTTLTVNVGQPGSPPSFVHPSCNRLFGGVCANVEYKINIRAGSMPGIQPLPVSPSAIQATDLDGRFPVRYSFANGTPSSFETYFFVDSQSGAVSQLKAVPTGLTSLFNITIAATKQGSSALPSSASLFIIVDDNFANNYPPVLKASSLQGFIEENSEMGSLVHTSDKANASSLQILVTDSDLKPGMPPATYQYVLTGLGATIFAVNQGGYVYLNTPYLDADPPNLSAYQLTIQAREVGTNPIRSSELINLSINVIDVNDNAPTFGSQSLEAVALADIGQQNIIEIRANDADRGKFGEVSYRIISVSNHGEAFFRYNRDSHYIVAIAPLAAGEQYQILLDATDGGGRSTQAVIVVDVESLNGFGPSIRSSTSFPNQLSQFNQSNILFTSIPPIVTEFNVTVNESAPVNSLVLSLKNSFKNAAGYAIVRGNEDSRFRIDLNNGFLTTALPLDRELNSKYRLLVQIVSFNANSNTTVVVNVDVLDVNDNVPKILNDQPIVFKVVENRHNAFVGQIKASDSDAGDNGRLTYSLIPVSQIFAIDPSNGTMRTLAPLKFADSRAYRLTVAVKDNGVVPNEVTAQVTVDIVENQQLQPYFAINSYNVSIQENTRPGEFLRVQAIPNQPGFTPITYELRQGDPSLFIVDALTGSVQTLSGLDAELKRTHTIIVGTRQNNEQNFNSTATITLNVLDVNDMVPVFQPLSYAATITDNVSPGAPIVQVIAEDNDLEAPNNVVRYQITGFGQARDYFRIDATTGLIVVSSDLQHAPKPDLILLVEAKDGGTPSLSSTATVLVSVHSTSSLTSDPLAVNSVTFSSIAKSSEEPRFSVKSFSASVVEGLAPAYFVQILPVENKTNAGSIQCSIVSGNYEGAFALTANDEGNCELRTQNVLDREKIDSYVLNVSVSHFVLSTSTYKFDYAEMHVFVIDVNDNAPQFQYETEYLGYKMYFGALDVNAREFSSVITVKAVDADLGNNSHVTYSIPFESPDSKYFHISSSGEIKNVKIFSTIVDKPIMFFQFRVEVKDTPTNGVSKSSMADVVINGLTNANRFVMVIEGILPDQLLKYIPLIKKSLQSKMGNCRVLGYESITESSSLASQEKPGTEIVWYAIDPTTGLICRRNQFNQLFDEEQVSRVRGELDVYFKMQTIKDSPFVVGSSASSSTSIFSYDKWQAAEIALIVLASIIAIGAIIGILSMCYFWTRYKASKRVVAPIDKMQLYAALPKYNALLLPPSEKEYEIQTLQMAMPDEQDNGKMMDADFSIEEGIYSINPPGRFDPFAHHPHNRQPPPHVYIPPPDYPLNSNNNSQTSIPNVHQRNNKSSNKDQQPNNDKTTIL